MYFFITSSKKNDIAAQNNNVFIIAVIESYVESNTNICKLMRENSGSIIDAINNVNAKIIIVLHVRKKNRNFVT